VIPHVEYYLNGVMNEVKRTLGPRHAALDRELGMVIRQEAQHARRMLRILLPWYDPAHLPVPARIEAALDFFRSTNPIERRFDPHATV
jgi:hypothetical protein